MQKNATFKQMFNSLNPDLDKLCLTQAQIISFAEDNKEELHPKGYGNFFLFKCDDKYFVANVSFYSAAGLEVHVDRLGIGRVWNADYRFRVVVPQLQ